MRNLFKNVANEIIQQLTPEDMKEIMNSTIDTVLEKMGPDERLAFSKEIVNNAVTKILSDFSEAQRVELVRALLPTLLTQAGADPKTLSLDEMAERLKQMGADSTPPI